MKGKPKSSLSGLNTFLAEKREQVTNVQSAAISESEFINAQPQRFVPDGTTGSALKTGLLPTGQPFVTTQALIDQIMLFSEQTGKAPYQILSEIAAIINPASESPNSKADNVIFQSPLLAFMESGFKILEFPILIAEFWAKNVVNVPFYLINNTQPNATKPS
jgi:hypothetical protein